MKTEPEELVVNRIREVLANLDNDILAQKIRYFKQYEKDALTMVEYLKAKGDLSPEEEIQLKVRIAEREPQPGE